MNQVAMMFPVLNTDKLVTSKAQTHQSSGDKQGLSDFAKLLNHQEMSYQVQQDNDLKEANQNSSLEEMMEELDKLDIKELEALIGMLLPEQELSLEYTVQLEELKHELAEMQRIHMGDSPDADLLVPVIEKVIQMTSPELLKDVLAYVQAESQVISARYYPEPPAILNKHSNINQYANQIMKQAETLLSNIETEKDLTKAAPKLLELLQQWQNVLAKAGQNADKMPVLNFENRQLSNIWQQLVEFYQNRTGVYSQQVNYLDPKGTLKDVIRLLSNAMDATVQHEKPVTSMPVMASMIPINKVDQFVIHLNQNQQAQPVDKQLIEQFQRIMDSNRISALQNSRGQLAITLKPHNLGEMIVRFTQVNGEVIVKILVASDSAKRMLEGNMQQLRSMFSPHQVVIDKQDAALAENQESEKQQPREEQKGSRDDAQSKQQNQQSENEAFSTIFEELVFNEEV